ncbi:MAG: FAD-binding protein, partial [Actinobacteria bacterium]|nr:FAD-binding protein [Actinomycetota bacterium]
ADILATGIQPVTVATTLLKPGGYARLTQLAGLATTAMRDADGIDVAALDALVARVLADERVHKRHREKVGSRKTTSPLPLTDCFKAPCEHGGCPIEQQIPEYLTLVAQQRYAEAFELIARDNTAPTITGVLCSEPCRDHCTRVDYDTAIDIRGVKLAAADAAQQAYMRAIIPAPLRPVARVAVIGAGPAGIAAALFLRRNGLDVEVFEKAVGPYGIVARIIPSFRITPEQIRRDFCLAQAAGVVFHFGCDPDYDLAELRTRFHRVIVATGSWGRGASPVREGGEHVVDALDFLAATHGGGTFPGRRIAVVGAGDVAMDCARTARRLPGVEHVALVY